MRRVIAKLFVFLMLPLIGVAGAAAVSRFLPSAAGRAEPPRAARMAVDREEDVAVEPLESETFGLLLCGIDNTQMLADVVIYARLDTVNDSACLLQLPRDLFVGERYTTGKLNEACLPFSSDNPAKRIVSIVEGQFGLPVDGWAVVTLAGVRALVDAVGGVPVELPREIDYLPGKTLPAGACTLSGEQAEWLLRYRKGYKMADLDRLEAQKLFLTGAFQAAKGVGKLQAIRIAAQNYGHIKTSLPFSLASTLIAEGMALTGDRIEMRVVPTYAAEYNGYSVLCVNRFRLAELLNESFFAADPVDPWELALQYPPEPAEESQPSGQPDQGYAFDFSWNEEDGYYSDDNEGVAVNNGPPDDIYKEETT